MHKNSSNHPKYKICFLTTALIGGGAQRVMVNLANAFAKDGYNVHIVCFVTKNCTSLYKIHPDIKLHNVPREYERTNRIVYARIKLLEALIMEMKPDVMIPFLMPIAAYASYVAKKLGIKIIMSERNDPYITPLDPYWRVRRDKIFKDADACVFQTESALNYFKKFKLKRCFIIRNPIDLTSIRNDIVPINKRSMRVVCVAKFEPQKNLDFLLEIFAEFVKTHPNYILEIYGNDFHGHRLLLKQKAIAMGIEDKVFLNNVRSNILEIIYDARMSILPSKYEGMPNALIESVCIGIPSIASDCPAYGGRIIIENEKNGFLLEVNNKKAFLEKMCLIAEDDELANRISIEGRKSVSKFDIKNVYNSWRLVVEEIIRGR